MKTLASAVAPADDNWMDYCAFRSRHQPDVHTPTSLIQQIEDTFPSRARPEPVIPAPIGYAYKSVTRPITPAKRQLPDSVRAELHSFRQLSSPFFCPETSLDTLPEYILFGLIVLLAAAWPILAMLGVMARY